MTQHNDLTARRMTSYWRMVAARLMACGALSGALLAADGLADGALNQPWTWGGVAILLAVYHVLTLVSARLLLGWQRRAIRRLVGQPDKRAVTTLRAVQIVDLAPSPDAPWWMDDSARSVTGAPCS